MGHSWKHRPPLGIDDPSDSFPRPFGMSTGMVGFPSHCSVCGADRMRWISRSGEVKVRYRYADGYSRHGDEVISPGDWRRSYVARVFDGFLQ